jgi:hypothetical protein
MPEPMMPPPTIPTWVIVCAPSVLLLVTLMPRS